MHKFDNRERLGLPEGSPPSTAEQPDAPSAEVRHEFEFDGDEL